MMTPKEKLELLSSFHEQAVKAGIAARFWCDGVLVLSCFEDVPGCVGPKQGALALPDDEECEPGQAAGC